MGPQPHGTVTFLFTDVEDSTRLWERDPDGMRIALADHDRMLRAAISRHEGHVFSTAGDGFAAAFWRPEHAIAAAADAQGALAGLREMVSPALQVRMGIHTGTADERDGDYFGPAVNVAARLMGAGHGGQVLVSLATEELVRDRLPPGYTLRDLGEHRLPSLSHVERVFQLCGPGLADRFPALRARSVAAGNIPVPATSYVGRGEALTRLADELPRRRLVTLTGVGGVGKTRLATEAALIVGEAFEDGTWLCELAPLAEPDAVAHAVATTLSIRLQEGLSIGDSVVEALRGRRLLLVLDNCEHVLEAAAELVGGVVRSCPTVTVLATSREPLGVTGERVIPVASLDPAAGVELFLDRASAADASFTDRGADRHVVGEVCQRLDGIPLAIELAAARVRSMTPADIAERLHDRFRLLRGGRRGVERHQTLRATVQWSYQLLSPPEQVLFDRLSVFAGDFDLAAAEAVCGTGPLDPVDVVDLLAGLVDKSMVVADRSGPHTRYRLLETLRQFGEERLADTDDAAALRDRHVAHYVAVAELARSQYEGRAHAAGAATLRAEWPNFRAAVQWAAATADTTSGAAIVEALTFFAWVELHYELGEWATALFAASDPPAKAYGVAALFAAFRADHAEALRLAPEGSTRSGSPNDRGTWLCWFALAVAHWYSGSVEEGWAAIQTVNEIVDADHHPFVAALMAATAANLGATGADLSAALSLLERATRLAAPLRNPVVDAYVTWASGVLERTGHRYDRAADHFRRALALAEHADNHLLRGVVPMSMVFMAAMTDAPGAGRTLQDAIATLYRSRDWSNTWPAVEALAVHWFQSGQLDRAAVVLGHLEANDIRHAILREKRKDACAALAGADVSAPLAQGASLGRDELVAFVLVQHDGDEAPSTRRASTS